MKIKQLLPHVFADGLMKQYSKICKIDNLEKYLQASWSNMENPLNYDNMNEGSSLLLPHIKNNSKIALIMHMDMDSMLSNVLLYQYIKKLNPLADIEVFFPEIKLQGLNKKVLKQLLDSDADLLIAADCCSSDLEEMKLIDDLNKKGWKNLDVLILDHHPISVGKKGVENYTVLINNQLSPHVLNKEACGAAVVFKFMQHLDNLTNNNYSMEYVDLVAMATVGDIMNVSSLENRIILNYGCNNITNPLLKAMIKEYEKSDGSKTTIHGFGWNINNKVNGVIKSGNTPLIEELFWSFVNPDKEVKDGLVKINIVEKMVKTLPKLYRKKRETIKELSKELELETDTNTKIIIVDGENKIPLACSGDIANYFQKKYNKPTLALMNDEKSNYYTGSCRSPIPVRDILNNTDCFVFVAGHSQAAGFKIKKSKLEDLKKAIGKMDLDTHPFVEVIKEIHDTKEATLFAQISDEHSDLWGNGFEKPLFYFKDIIKSDNITKMRGAKWKFDTNSGFRLIKSFVSNEEGLNYSFDLGKDLKIEVVGTLNINEWNGYSTTQMEIEKIELREIGKKKLRFEDIW